MDTIPLSASSRQPRSISAKSQREALHASHCDTDRDWSCDRPKLRFAEGGRLIKLSFARSPGGDWNDEIFGVRGGKRGKCKGFSAGSRRRMLDRLNQVSVGATLPQFVTMTLPDDVFCDDVVEFAMRAKDRLDSFEKRLLRVCPGACGFWRIEWKARKSGSYEGKWFPHFHLLVWGLPERSLGERPIHQKGWTDAGQEVEFVERWEEVFEAYVDCPDTQLTLQLLDLWSDASKAKGVDDYYMRCENGATGRVFAGSGKFVNRARTLEDCCLVAGLCPRSSSEVQSTDEMAERARLMSFQDWASLAWYHVVGSHNLDHAQAGVRVERVRSWGGVMCYAAKYMSKADAELMGDLSWGRSWGCFNRAWIPWARMVELNLDNEVGVRLRRVARHYLTRRLGRRINASYGITLYCDTAQFRRLWDAAPLVPF